MSCHNRMMNLPAPESNGGQVDKSGQLIWKTGVRDARHAGAEALLPVDQLLEDAANALDDLLKDANNPSCVERAHKIMGELRQEIRS